MSPELIEKLSQQFYNGMMPGPDKVWREFINHPDNNEKAVVLGLCVVASITASLTEISNSLERIAKALEGR